MSVRVHYDYDIRSMPTTLIILVIIPITNKANYIRKELRGQAKNGFFTTKRILGSVNILLSRYESRPTGYLPVLDRAGGSGKSERIP